MELNYHKQSFIARKAKSRLFIESSARCLVEVLITSVIILLSGCEDIDRFYRPNLPEKLCCIGIIDMDNTLHDSLLALPYGLNGNFRNISFEKSYQSEYDSENNDSLRGFSFSISTSEGEELVSYSSDSTIKELRNFQISEDVEFLPGETYYLHAKEDNTPEITAKITVPESPPTPEIISYRIESTTMSKPLPCTGRKEIRTAVLDLSFDNQGKNKYYAVVIVGEGFSLSSSLVHLYDYLDFTVKDSNYPGFFAILHGLKMLRLVCIDDESHMNIEETPVYAYFIDGNKNSDTKCRMTICIQYFDSRCVYDIFRSLTINLIAIPEGLYLFEKSLYTYDRVIDDPFSEPVYLNGNIHEGNGIFAICRGSKTILKPGGLF